MDIEPSGQIVMVTGSINAGKTTFCQYAVHTARKTGIRVAGLLSRGVWSQGQKVGVTIENLSTGVRWPFAHSQQTFPGPSFGRFSFSQQTIDQANNYLNDLRTIIIDLLIIDEIGPLECTQGEGLQAVWPLLAGGQYRTAIITVRPRLIPVLQERCGTAIKGVLSAENSTQQQLWDDYLRLTSFQGRDA